KNVFHTLNIRNNSHNLIHNILITNIPKFTASHNHYIPSLHDALPIWTPEKGAEAIADALRKSAEKEFSLSDEQIAELGIALSDGKIRDACLATASPPNTPLAHQAARLWQCLARALPDPERAEAACLAAFAAYQAGDGTLARIALDVALQANPSHVLAGLLDR